MAMKKNYNIHADEISIGENFSMGENSIIRGETVAIGDNVHIGDNVDITCDSLSLGDNSKVGANSVILSPVIDFADNCRVGNNFAGTLNHYFKMGKFSAMGHRVNLAGQGFECGEFLWLKNDVILGGGGSQGPDSYLIIGDRTSIFDRSYVNLSERVEIGSDSALSYDVVLLTHGAWQPALDGYTTSFGPIIIGDNSVVYLKSVIMPGVTIGSNTTIGSNSTVMKDVADNALAVGSPARIVKSENYPKAFDKVGKREFILDVLQDYFSAVEAKGAEIKKAFDVKAQSGVLSFEGQDYTLAYADELAPIKQEGQLITIGSRKDSHSETHFDIMTMQVSGVLSPIAEDLRDYLRRRAIKFFNGKSFKSLPLVNVKRLRAKRSGA